MNQTETASFSVCAVNTPAATCHDLPVVQHRRVPGEDYFVSCVFFLPLLLIIRCVSKNF